VVPIFKRLIEEGADHLPVTHEDMTRFWITLEQGVEFVIKSFSRMWGGEIFVPKIPSVRIMDLAKAMAPNLPQRIIGLRPGEKLHEVMCPKDDSHLTLAFLDHFLIKPSITFFSRDNTFLKNVLKEEGAPVPLGFEYNSNHNLHFLSVEEIVAMNHQQDSTVK
jgi:UDP-N-acetylglucosamine 4,6-dehydratase